MERAHRHASELTKSSIDIDGDVEVIAAATDHLHVKLQCRPRSLRREQQTCGEVGARMLVTQTMGDGSLHSPYHRECNGAHGALADGRTRAPTRSQHGSRPDRYLKRDSRHLGVDPVLCALWRHIFRVA